MDTQLAEPKLTQRAIPLERSKARARWLQRGLLGFLVLLIALPLVGMTYQTAATQMDARRYLPAGQLTNIGGYMLHIHCSGEGSPAVILEGGLGGTSLDWSLVQPEIAKTTRVCSYDRAGLGWSESDPSSAARTSDRIAEQLYTLLQNTGIAGPYVLAGLSAGGLHVQVFANRYPDEVVGMILVDPTPAHLMAAFTPEERRPLLPDLDQFATLERIEPFGVLRLLPLPGSETLENLPSDIRTRVRAVNLRSGAITALHQEAAGFESSILQTAALPSLPARLPMTIIWHGIPAEPLELEPLAEASLRKLVEHSDHGKFIIAEYSSHYITFDRPDIVIAEIKATLNTIRSEIKSDVPLLVKGR